MLENNFLLPIITGGIFTFSYSASEKESQWKNVPFSGDIVTNGQSGRGIGSI